MAMDPVRVSVMNNRFTAIVEEASATLHRTAHTTFVKLVQDYQCALATPDGDIFAYPSQSGVTSFIGLPLNGIIDALDTAALRPGDCIITNDPFGTDGVVTHMMDVTLLRPIFVDDRLLAFAWAFVHASDIGGAVPGSISPAFTEIFQEGLRLRPVHLFRAGRLNNDVKNILLDNSRIPDELWGDLTAMLSALQSMDRRLTQLCQRYGFAEVRAAMDEVIAFSEAKTHAVFAQIPDGTYRFSDYVEGIDEGDLVQIQAAMHVRGDKIELDFTGTDPQIAAAYNIVSGRRTHPYIALALISYVLSVEPDTPRNAGLLRPVSTTVPRGTVLNAEFPAPGGSRVASGSRVYDVVLGCLNRALPGGVTAAGAGASGIIVVSARDPLTGRNRVSVINPICGGSGGRRAVDGVDGIDSRHAALRSVPAEIVEIETVMVMRAFKILEDSQAAGRWRGGAAVVLELENDGLEATMTVRGMNRFRFRPWGIRGGEPGRLGEVVLNPGMPSARSIGKIKVLELRRGDVVKITTSSGGGFGDPLDREPARVALDVRHGVLSTFRARSVYGVVLGAAGAVDEIATARERANCSRERPARPMFSLGPERDEYDRIWPVEIRARLARRVLAEAPDIRKHLMRAVRVRLHDRTEPVDETTLDRTIATELEELGQRLPGAAGIRKGEDRR